VVDPLPQKGVYPVTESLIDWLSHKFEAIDEGVYLHFRGIRRIMDKVDRGEQGSVVHKMQARSYLREYNDQNGTNVQYEEVVHRTTNYIPAFQGEWVVFTDDSEAILRDDEADNNLMIEDALYCAPTKVRWAVLWDPQEAIIIVYRSPVLRSRLDINPDFLLSCGMTKGGTWTFALPEEVEGVIKQDLDDYNASEGGPYGCEAESFSNCLSDRGPVERPICITEYLPWLKRS